MKEGKSKTHYAHLEPANESDNTNYWGVTACGLEHTESELTNDLKWVTCKNCLKRINRRLKNETDN